MHEHKGHGIVAALAAATASFFVTAIGLHWAWNKLAAGLFGAPAMQFAHAVALLILVGVLSITAGLGMRGGCKGHRVRLVVREV